MKILEKIALIIFANIILILSILGYTILFAWVSPSDVSLAIESMLAVDRLPNVLAVIFGLFILLAVRCIFFSKPAKVEEKSRQGILLENESGRLLISKETLESLVVSIVSDFENTTDVVTKVELDKNNEMSVNINMVVTSSVIIKDLTAKMQKEIKEQVKRSTDLEVKEINVTVKKVENEISKAV